MRFLACFAADYPRGASCNSRDLTRANEANPRPRCWPPQPRAAEPTTRELLPWHRPCQDSIPPRYLQEQDVIPTALYPSDLQVSSVVRTISSTKRLLFLRLSFLVMTRKLVSTCRPHTTSLLSGMR